MYRDTWIFHSNVIPMDEQNITNEQIKIIQNLFSDAETCL